MLQSGQIISELYRLDRLLGRGAMGEVWLAHHVLLDIPRAIKFLSVTFGNDTNLRERFIQREARYTLQLVHPNIVRVYELSLLNDTPYLVMEYIEGGRYGTTLRDLIRNKSQLSLNEIGVYLDQLAGALDYSHGQGILHRDVKPANILVDGFNRLKLTDFGLLKSPGDEEESGYQTSSGMALGTPTYMAPEQADGQSVPASDIYSLGCILYEMLAGKPPFSGSLTSLLLQHAQQPPPPLQQLNPALPAALDKVVQRALAKVPADRYVTATELAQAYQQVVTGLSTSLDAPGDKTEMIETVAVTAHSFKSSGSTLTRNPLATIPNNLPTTLTSFIGRQEQLDETSTLLQNSRLLTLLGPGGMGKTRLSIELGRHLLPSFPDGAWLIELAPLTDPGQVIEEVAGVLGIQEQGDRPLLAVVREFVQDKTLLLILDNCEHLVAACAELAETLLKAGLNLRILTSSREALGVGGETTWRIPTLQMPDPAHLPTPTQLAQYEAIRLFVDRAASRKPGFSVTSQNAAALAQLCYQLDGIPLALELAAVRISTLSVEQIVARLDQRFKLLTGGSRTALPRQQTLRALVDWSYDLLDEPERVLLGRLSVFRGGWRLEAAEAVCAGEYPGGELSDFEILDVLGQLVNKSLAQANESADLVRYRQLETIRQYGQEKLAEAGPAEVERWQQAHADYFLTLALEAEPELTGPVQGVWLARLDEEQDNLRAVLKWTLSRQGDAIRLELGLKLAASLWRFWLVRGYLSEGRRWLEQLLSAPGSSNLADRSSRATAFKGAGILANQQLDAATARRYYEESLNLLRELNDLAGQASILNNLGVVAYDQGDYAEARRLYEESLALFRQLGNDWAAANILNNLGLVAREQADLATARRYLEDSLVLMRRLSDPAGLANTLSSLGDVLLDCRDYTAAGPLLRESLAIHQRLDDPVAIAQLLEFLAGQLAALAQPFQALQLAAAAATLHETVGAPLTTTEQATLDRRLAAAYQSLDPQSAQAAWDEGRQLSAAEAIRLALDTNN